MAKEETKREAGDAEGSKNGETAPDDVVDEVEERKCDKWDFMKLSVLVDDIFAQELHSMFKDYARVEHLSNIKLGISIVALIVGIFTLVHEYVLSLPEATTISGVGVVLYWILMVVFTVHVFFFEKAHVILLEHTEDDGSKSSVRLLNVWTAYTPEITTQVYLKKGNNSETMVEEKSLVSNYVYEDGQVSVEHVRKFVESLVHKDGMRW
eukprot:m.72082 g.72082  ORF g.72082 m.72082 type:complete len:209 (-) comp11726_c0_seq3:265-891(-)